MRETWERDREIFGQLLVELEQRGGDAFLEELFLEQLDLREEWLDEPSVN